MDLRESRVKIKKPHEEAILEVQMEVKCGRRTVRTTTVVVLKTIQCPLVLEN